MLTLRARLSLVILAAVLLPLLGGIVVVSTTVPDAIRDQTRARLDSSRQAVATLLAERCERLGGVASELGLTASRTSPGEATGAVVASGQADYAAVLGPDGDVVAEAGSRPPGVPPGARGTSCSRGEQDGTATPVLGEGVDVTGSAALGRAVVLTRLDGTGAAELRRAVGLDGGLTLAEGDRVVASTLAPARARRALEAATAGRADTADGDTLVSAASPGSTRPVRVVVTSPEPTSRWLVPGIVGVLAVALLLAGLLGWRMARELTRPLAELTAGAERVARGDLDARIPVRSRDEVGRMAVAFNDMTERVRAQVDELARGRDALQASLDRVGGALARTHDLDGILGVVADTAVSAVGAEAGAVYLGSAGGPLRLRAAGGPRAPEVPMPDEVRPGEGVVGGVARVGMPVRGTLGQEGLEPAPGEPAAGHVLAAPLRRGAAVVGVVVTVRGESAPYAAPGVPGPEEAEAGDGFTERDLETVRTLAAQASVAVDNVLLHEEAQRLSITDPLTGLWNFRYLSMSLNRELDRASRFDRPVAVLMLDLDHFKDVNDTYGHQRGDTVLHELAQRVAEQIREVDTFARYGGEEFALVLPETDEAGAALVAERVRTAVRRAPFTAPGQASLDVTVSVGGALFPLHGGTPATLLRAADEALYAAKRAGRDRWSLASATAGPDDATDPAEGLRDGGLTPPSR